MADFDGIQERESGMRRMPLGMTILFLGLIVFGVSYIWLYLPQTTGWTQSAQYESALKAHQAMQAPAHKEVESAESAAHERAEAVARGEKIYAENCMACHGDKLSGGIGPALTGPQFRYGASVEDQIHVVSKGTPNGMPGFEKQLGATQIYNVAVYLQSNRKQ